MWGALCGVRCVGALCGPQSRGDGGTDRCGGEERGGDDGWSDVVWRVECEDGGGGEGCGDEGGDMECAHEKRVLCGMMMGARENRVLLDGGGGEVLDGGGGDGGGKKGKREGFVREGWDGWCDEGSHEGGDDGKEGKREGFVRQGWDGSHGGPVDGDGHGCAFCQHTLCVAARVVATATMRTARKRTSKSAPM